MVKDEVIKPSLENPHEELPQILGEATPLSAPEKQYPWGFKSGVCSTGQPWVISAGGVSGLGTVKEAVSLG